MNKKHESMKIEAIENTIELLKDYSGYYCDLHHEVFNTDYYIIGKLQAEKALEEYGVFKAIEIVRDYEIDNLGEIYTDLSDPEKLVNMLFYVIGNEVIDMLLGIEEFNEAWDDIADEDLNCKCIEYLEEHVPA